MKKIFYVGNLIALFTLILPTVTFAHVTVSPKDVGVGKRLNFVVSVPTEEGEPTVGLRLVVPKGVTNVRPNVKPGWKIELIKAGESMKGEILNTGERAPDPDQVMEILWTGGQIPADQRDEFIFSAQAPTTTTTLAWKAYQTYAGGHIVSWDADPKAVEEYIKNNPPKEGDHDESAPKPWSEVSVVDDLSITAETVGEQGDWKQKQLPMVLSIVALVISALALKPFKRS